MRRRLGCAWALRASSCRLIARLAASELGRGGEMKKIERGELRKRDGLDRAGHCGQGSSYCVCYCAPASKYSDAHRAACCSSVQACSCSNQKNGGAGRKWGYFVRKARVCPRDWRTRARTRPGPPSNAAGSSTARLPDKEGESINPALLLLHKNYPRRMPNLNAKRKTSTPGTLSTVAVSATIQPIPAVKLTAGPL